MEFTTSDHVSIATRTQRQSEVDLTSMVDVTFLLIVFFMVTASFVTHQVLEQNKPDGLSCHLPLDIDEPLTLVVSINEQNDLYFDSTSTFEPTNLRELRTEFRAALESHPDVRLLIEAHTESRHRSVVKVWDTALAAGLDNIAVTTTDQNDY